MNEGLPVHGPRDSAASQPQNGAALHLKHCLQTKTQALIIITLCEALLLQMQKIG
jgi:hypothetical protein